MFAEPEISQGHKGRPATPARAGYSREIAEETESSPERGTGLHTDCRGTRYYIEFNNIA